MANQIIIDIGAVANDGTGDPLRTAFGYVNNNFSNIWATGVANSNIQFSGNRILTANTNGNLVLAPNGIGKVQSNVDIVPNANNTLSLGGLDKRWNTVYAQNLDVGGNTTLGDLTVGHLTVEGNLTVDGDIIQIGNIVTDSKTIQLANTAGTTTAANGAGITVGANDNIATLLYNSTSNVWTTNIGITALGNVAGNYFIGNGSLLTGIASPYGNANVAAYLPTYTGNLAAGNLTVSNGSNTWIISGQYITAPGGAFWHSHPEESADDFVGAPGSNIRIQSIDVNSAVESQINLTNTNIEIVVDNGVSKTWRFNESGITEFPGCLTPVVSVGGCANIGNLSNPWLNVYASGNVNAGNISLTGTVSSNLVPTANNTQTLGTNTNRWSNLYLSGNTIYLGALSLSAGADGLTSSQGFDLANSTAANIEATGNITANYFLGNVEGLIGNITNLNSVNFAVENIGALVGNNGVNIGAGGNNNLVVLPDEVLIQNVPLTVAGNILSTVAGGLNITANTVANGVAQTWNFGTDGILTFPGTPRIDTDANNFEVQAAESINFEANAVVNIYTDTSGTTYQWQFGDDGNLNLPNGGSIIIDGGDGVIGPDGDNMVISWDNEELILRSVGSDVDVEADRDFNIRVNYDGGANDYLTKWVFGQDNEIINITGNSAIITEAGNLNLQGGRNTLSSGNVQITAVNNGVAVNAWTFDNTGTLTAPGNIAANWLNISNVGNIASLQADVSLQIVANASGSAPYWQFNSDGTLFVPGNIAGDNNGPLIIDGNGSGTEGYISLPASNFGGEQIAIVNQFSSGNGIALTTNGGSWHFDNTGNLTVPGNIVMPPGTSLVGNGASPAPNISGFSSATFGADVTATGNISGGNIVTGGRVSATGNIVTGGQIQSSAFTGGNISWSANSQVDFQGAIKVGGTGVIKSPGGASSITLNNNGANIPILGVTNTSNSTSTTTGALIVSGGAGVAGNVYVGGNIVGNTAGFAIGYRDIPQVSFTGNATIATTDAGKHFYSTQSSNYILTIANNASQGFQVGAAITIVNQGTGTITIAQGSDVTLYLAGNATSGNRSVATFGMATIMKVATDTWFINGTGVS